MLHHNVSILFSVARVIFQTTNISVHLIIHMIEVKLNFMATYIWTINSYVFQEVEL